MKEVVFEYHQEGDYLIDNYETHPLNKELRKWGREFLKFMEDTKPHLANMKMMLGELLPLTIERQKMAEEMEQDLTEKLKIQYGVTNELHNENPIEWSKRMNQIRHEVESQIMKEVICI